MTYEDKILSSIINQEGEETGTEETPVEEKEEKEEKEEDAEEEIE